MRQLELYKYNPGQCRPEELEATFVARESILDGILRDLRDRSKTPANQHFLIVGPRGIGKTNLLLLILHRVSRDPELSGAYLPLCTAEEEYSVASLRDFFARVLDLLTEAGADEDLHAAAAAFREEADDEHATDLALEALKSFRQRTGRKLLLLVDNLDLILDEQLSDDAEIGKLRDVLMNDSFLVLIGAAPTHFREVSGYDRPFYNFFKSIDLEDLSGAQMAEMFRKRAEWDDNRAILDRSEELRPRLEAVHHLTGGNPRLTLMLYQLYTQTELPEVRAALQMLLDDLTPYYKARIEQLSPQQRKVMDTFARLGRPVTPTELAAESRLPVNQVNSILKRLRELGFVAVAKQARRKTTLYVVSERVFRIWHQMRFSTAGRRKLEFLIEFIRIWYSAQEWRAEADRLMGEYLRAASEGAMRGAGRFVEHLEYLVEAAPRTEWGHQVSDDTVRACIESGDFDRAEGILQDRLRRYAAEHKDDRLADTWYLTAYLRTCQQKKGDAVSALKRVVELRPDDHHALNNWGAVLHNLALRKTRVEREQLLRQSIEKYEAALNAKPDYHLPLSNWGAALHDLALLKTGAEQEGLLGAADEKVSQAVQAVAESGDEAEHATAYSVRLLHLPLFRSALAIEADNAGQARTLFDAALEHLPTAAPERVREELTGFFRRVVRAENASLCAEFFDAMRSRKMDDLLGVLEPFRVAVEYWQKDSDPEVLDRLNPEVRELVEAIISGKGTEAEPTDRSLSEGEPDD